MNGRHWNHSGYQEGHKHRPSGTNLQTASYPRTQVSSEFCCNTCDSPTSQLPNSRPKVGTHLRCDCPKSSPYAQQCCFPDEFFSCTLPTLKSLSIPLEVSMYACLRVVLQPACSFLNTQRAFWRAVWEAELFPLTAVLKHTQSRSTMWGWIT